MNLSLWVGIIFTAALIPWTISKAGFTASSVDLYGIVLVAGGLFTAMMVNCSFAELWSATRSFLNLFGPSPLPSVERCQEQMTALARKAQREGGLLSLQQDALDFAGGFLHRAIMVAISSGESAETRRIMEEQIRQRRIAKQEDANVFRTMSVLSPMFGLLGTLLGMVRVLQSMSDPIKAAAGMALALSSAFLGIGIANVFCLPVAGKIRLIAMRETMTLDLLLEGVLDIAAGKSPYLVEMHLAAYSQKQRARSGGTALPTETAAAPGTSP